jgi:hypothetical protein
MKKIFLLILTSILVVPFISCSKDSSSSTPTAKASVSASIDGVQRIFSKIQVIQTPWTDTITGVRHVDLHITAMNPDDNTEYVHFGIGKGDIGENQLWDFGYVRNGTGYIIDDPGGTDTQLYDITTINIEKRVVGSFNGRVTSKDSITGAVKKVLVFTNGIFDISY